MLRFQQERVMGGVLDPNCAYQPPWTDKHFYLLDGFGRRQILVDESRSPKRFEETIPESMAYLRPTAGKLRGRWNNSLEVYRVKNTEVRIKFQDAVCAFEKGCYSPLEWRERERHLANPMIINPDWKVIVRELQWNLFEKVYPLWKRELAPGKRQLCENDRDNVFAAAGEVSSSKALVVQLPQEVWELIIADLDGLSFLRLVHSVTNLGIGQVLWDALKANVTAKKTRGLWRKTCLQEMSYYAEIITSYSNCILEGGGNVRRSNDVPFYDATLDHDSQDVVEAAHACIDKLIHGKLEVKNMTALENKIKTNLQLHYEAPQKKKKVDLVSGQEVQVPERDVDDYKPFIVETIGSISYYVMHSLHGLNLIIMEDLDKCEERRLSIACEKKIGDSGHRILYTKIMNLPRYKGVENSPDDNSLPEIDRVIFSVCRKCSSVRSLDGTTGFSCLYEVKDEIEAEAFNNMEPILVMHEDVYVLWYSPMMPIKFYQLKQVRHHYARERLLVLNINDQLKYWNLLCNYTQHFIPVLRKVPNKGTSAVDKKFIREIFGNTHADADHYYELLFVSMRLGTDSISLRNTYELKPNPNDLAAPSEPFFNIHHRNPQYYYKNALQYRSLLDVCYSGCVGPSWDAYLYIFWNHKALACSWGDGTTWIFHTWKKALSSLVQHVPSFADSDNLFVSQMTVCSSEVVAACVNGHVVIFKASRTLGEVYENPDKKDQRYAEEPSFTMEPLRLVELDLISKNLTIEQFTFTFDKGEPYFTLQYRDKSSKNVLDFWISRICFNVPEAILEEEEEENQIISDTANPSTSTPLHKRSLPEAIALTMIGCNLLNLKKRIGLMENETKTYSQLVDEILANPNNVDVLNLEYYPSIVYEALESVGELGSDI